MQLQRFDHLVLTVADRAVSCQFYQAVLGMRVEDLGDGRQALHFGQQKINLHQKGHEIDPKAHRPTEGSADLCFIADTPVADVHAELLRHRVAIVAGPVERTGAQGKIMSIYFRDPDLNLLEVSNYL
jgi:catechol 2,3-dioxygenase-like lactoylglutathione lyase family enzyme